MRFLILAALLAAGCRGVPDASSPQALVRALTADAASCDPDGTPICEARVIGVDGRRVLAAEAVAIEPGRRRLTVFCHFNLSIMIGDSQTVERVLVADLAAGGRYRLAARMTPEPCSVTLVREAR
jgi:hypothetical protein